MFKKRFQEKTDANMKKCSLTAFFFSETALILWQMAFTF